MAVYVCELVCQIPFQHRVAAYKLTIREITTSSTNKEIRKRIRAFSLIPKLSQDILDWFREPCFRCQIHQTSQFITS